ncbi:MAG: protein-export chaperone SecB [Rhodovarius sp.]|nr:protein-export chaperone SecB [Rhodovarius sp.]
MSDQAPPAPLVVNAQYIRDLSFEVPGAPAIFAELREPPQIDLRLDVQARPIDASGRIFEVSLDIRADARSGERVCFIAELVYCGVFTVHVDEQSLEPVLLVECPRLLFPFARNILAEMTREGGFPPVYLNPIDFVALWQSRRGSPDMEGAVQGTA